MPTNPVKLELPQALLPDERGFYGRFGGRFVPEILLPNLEVLQQVFYEITQDQSFWESYLDELAKFSGRPTPVTHARNLSQHLGGAQIYLKREDLGQTGAHKINNVIGQGLLMKRLGKKRVIAETGAGQHGVATATMAARFGLQATVYMGAEDVARQRPNVFWMEQLGAEVVAVEDGARTLKDAINAALRDWAENFADSHYLLGTACGPHPFPALVAFLQSVIGLEASRQLQSEYQIPYPDKVFACVGGGSNALGLFQGFLDHPKVEIYGVEAGGLSDKPGQHAARLAGGLASMGIAQGYQTLFLQDASGQMLDTYSIAAGLDYIGVSPIIADLAAKGRISVVSSRDQQVIDAARLLMRFEGIIPALESSHGLAAAIDHAKDMDKEKTILVNLSGRGDKDIFNMADVFGDKRWFDYLAERAAKAREGDRQ